MLMPSHIDKQLDTVEKYEDLSPRRRRSHSVVLHPSYEYTTAPMDPVYKTP
jgi:hypothetical protein